MGYDIDESLNDIIFKYHLDKYYPKYSSMLRAKKMIQQLSSQWNESDRIACLTIGEDEAKNEMDAVYFLDAISPPIRKQIDFIPCSKTNPSQNGHNWNLYDYEKIDHTKWNEYQYIYVISNYNSQLLDFRLRDKHVRYLSIYDYFVMHGLHDFSGSNDEWYQFIVKNGSVNFGGYNDKVFSPVLHETYQIIKNYDESSDAILLKKIFFCSLVLRNFLLAQETLEKILNSNIDESRMYERAWLEIQKLLLDIKFKLKNKSENIACLWVDCVTYEELEQMPFVKSLQDKSIWFSNMISVTGYTSETLRTMFLGKRLLDDNTLSVDIMDETNSPIINNLRDQGYAVKFVGPDIGKSFPSEYSAYTIRNKKFPRIYPSSCLLWESLRQLVLYDEKMFIMTHLCLETHTPWYSININDPLLLLSDMTNRKSFGYSECDRQLGYYTNFTKSMTTVVFSDHGGMDFFPRQHIVFSICGEQYVPRDITGLCSNIDFHKIIADLLKKRNVDECALRRDYVEIQGTNARGGNAIQWCLDLGYMPQAGLKFQSPYNGYKGVVTNDYVYVYTKEREWLQERKNLFQPRWYRCLEDICDETLLLKFRNLSSDGLPSNMQENDYYKKLDKIYHNARSRNEKKVLIANKLVSKFDGMRMAIYAGGIDSREFYYMLNIQNRKRILGVLEVTENCPCNELNIPIIDMRAEDAYCMEVIFVTSPIDVQPILEEFKKGGSPTIIVSFYDYLKDNGVVPKTDFWKYEIDKGDLSAT